MVDAISGVSAVAAAGSNDAASFDASLRKMAATGDDGAPTIEPGTEEQAAQEIILEQAVKGGVMVGMMLVSPVVMKVAMKKPDNE